MAAKQEWDWPPERRPAVRPARRVYRDRPTPQRPPPRTPWHSTPLYTKLANLWIGAVFWCFKMVVAAVCGLLIAGSIWVIAQVASQLN
jgi:hypothetical protein